MRKTQTPQNEDVVSRCREKVNRAQLRQLGFVTLRLEDCVVLLTLAVKDVTNAQNKRSARRANAIV